MTTLRGASSGSRPRRPLLGRHLRRETLSRPMAWRGGCAILFGVFAFSRTWNSTQALVLAFGVYAAFEALAAFLAAFGLRNRPLAVIAAVDAIAAASFLFGPAPPLLTFSHVLGAWAMLTGILELFAAGALRRPLRTERAQAAAGVVSILLGIGLGIFPELGSAELAGWLGATMILFGCFCVLAAARVRFDAVSIAPRANWRRRGAA